MRAEAEDKQPNETGGIFFGYWVPPYKNAVITHAIGPGPLADHKPDFFRPDSSYQEKALERLFYFHRCRQTYLGDWHTHPTGSAYLSNLDRRTLRRIANHGPAQAPYPLMGVMSNDRGWFLEIWQWRAGRDRLRAILPRLDVRVEPPPGEPCTS